MPTVNVILPSILIGVMEIAIFMLATDEMEKIPISFTCLLAYSVFQLMIAKDMPRTADNIPLLSMYIILQMAYIGLAILGQGFVFLALWHRDQYTPVPDRIMAFALRIGKLAGVGDNLLKTISNLDGQRKIKSDKKQRGHRERHSHGRKEDNEIARHRHARFLENGISPYPVEEILEAARDQIMPDPDGNWYLRRNSQIDYNLVSADQSPVSEAMTSSTPLPSVPLRLQAEKAEVQKSVTMATHQRLTQAEINRINRQDQLVEETLDMFKRSRQSKFIRNNWLYIASVIDRFIMIVYVILVTATPIVLFFIIPTIKFGRLAI